MYFTFRQTLNNLTCKEYRILKLLSKYSKNIVNETLYIIKTEYRKTGKCFTYLDVEKRIHSFSRSMLQSNVSQQSMMDACDMFAGFYELLHKKLKGEYSGEVHVPGYIKKDGFFPIIIVKISPKVKSKGYFEIPYSYKFKKDHARIRIYVPDKIRHNKIKEIKIVPRYGAKIFEVHYLYELQEDYSVNLDRNKSLAIDLGINNFATCVDSNGRSFIIDGKKLKSYNQWYIKYNAYLEKIKTKQEIGNFLTRRQISILNKRNNRINDYMNKAVRYIVNYCIQNNLGNLVLGYNKNFQFSPKMDVINNQNFSSIPFSKFKEKLKHLCEYYGILFYEQEESYTSLASFLDHDDIPDFDSKTTNQYIFSGKRIKRGLYKSAKGQIINADLNGALNILKKSKVVPDAIICLYNSGVLNPPIRIRLHK